MNDNYKVLLGIFIAVLYGCIVLLHKMEQYKQQNWQVIQNPYFAEYNRVKAYRCYVPNFTVTTDHCDSEVVYLRQSRNCQLLTAIVTRV